ncbi:MAG TPA: hypothetical protein VJ732_05505 [Bryobacteraceae bacterium]|nr:hypothetical protein [Bryobacteraceae bacterium]
MGWRYRVAAFLWVAASCPAARLTAPAARAFDDYIATVETRLSAQHSNPATYLVTLRSPAAEERLLSGDTLIEPVHGGSWHVPGGLMHHWRAAALVPGADAEQMLALLKDAGHLSRYYAPQVVSSRSLASAGNSGSLIRFKKQKIVTVVLDAEFEGHNQLTGGNRGYSFTRSTHIWQVDQPGTAREHRRPEGDDSGYLWRLNSYWSFLQGPAGLFIECEAVSLTRDVPLGLGWLITPIIQDLPRESLEFTLGATKNALMAYARKEETRDDRAN